MQVSKKAKRGRPPKSEPRDHGVFVRMTEEEQEEVCRFAEHVGLGAGSWGRMIMLANARREKEKEPAQ